MLLKGGLLSLRLRVSKHRVYAPNRDYARNPVCLCLANCVLLTLWAMFLWPRSSSTPVCFESHVPNEPPQRSLLTGPNSSSAAPGKPRNGPLCPNIMDSGAILRVDIGNKIEATLGLCWSADKGSMSGWLARNIDPSSYDQNNSRPAFHQPQNIGSLS